MPNWVTPGKAKKSKIIRATKEVAPSHLSKKIITCKLRGVRRGLSLAFIELREVYSSEKAISDMR